MEPIEFHDPSQEPPKSSMYDVLRILRGSGKAGLPCREIAVGLVTRDPDVTGLTDRLLRLGFAIRRRSKEDRRVVRVTITGSGKEIPAGLENAVRDLNLRRFGLLSRKKLGKFLATLRMVREAQGPRKNNFAGWRAPLRPRKQGARRAQPHWFQPTSNAALRDTAALECSSSFQTGPEPSLRFRLAAQAPPDRDQEDDQGHRHAGVNQPVQSGAQCRASAEETRVYLGE